MFKEEEFIKFLSVRRDFAISSIQTVLRKLKLYLSFHQSNYISSTYNESFEAFIYGKKNEGLLNNSLNTYVNAFNLFCDFIEYKNKIVIPRFNFFKKNSTLIEPLTVEEEEKILNSCLNYGKFHGLDCSRMNDVYCTFSRLLSSVGCRFDEAARLLIEDLHLDSGYIVFRKTKNREDRKAFISQPLINQLRNLVKDHKGLVFINMTGHKLHAQDYMIDLKLRAKLVGVNKKVHPHIFRHSFGTEIKRRGGDIQDIKKLLGHKDIKSTERYVHLADDHLQNIAMRHPLNSEGANPELLIKQAEDYIWTFLSLDKRFDKSMIKKSIALLYKSIIVDTL